MKTVRVGIIPAAGKGNRINDLPLTRILPKPMLPILDKPILEYVIENMKKLGVEVLYMIVGFRKDVIKEYFRNGEEWGIKIYYIEQKKLRGIAHAISLAKNYVSEPFAVILGDDFTIAESLYNIVESFFAKSAWAVEGVVIEKDVEAIKRTCCLTMNEHGRVIEIEEKPNNPKSHLRGCGIYIFDPVVFEYIERTPITPFRNEMEITTTLKIMAENGKVYGSFINGINVNINTFDDLMKAAGLLFKFRYGKTS